MALHDVLSAMRVIILDLPVLPEAAPEREQQFAALFPSLSSDELTDLARIDPEGWRTYTSSIFIGERSILKGHFPMTFAHLEKLWPVVFHKPLRSVEFLRAVHERSPWRSAQTLDLVQNFCDYVQNELPQLMRPAPFLSDLVEVEHASMRIRRAVESETPADLISPEMLAPMTVEALLELHITLRPLHRKLRLDWDMFSYRELFIQNGKVLPKSVPVYGETVAIGGRDSELTVRWVRVPKSIWEALADSGERVAVEDFAEIVIGHYPEESEQRQLELTVGFVAQFALIGMVRLGAPDSLSTFV